MGIKGGQVKSVKALKASVKRGGGFGGLKRVPKDEPLVVRFLTEPDEWFEFFEHYDEVAKRYVACTDDCDFCDDDDRPSKRVLAPVVLIEENKVEPLAMPASLASRLLNKYDKYATMLDRDYELIRTGDGLDTEYDVNPEDKQKRNLSRYEVPDLQEVLEGLSTEDEDDEENTSSSDRRGSKAKKKLPPKKSTRRRTDDEDDGDDEDDEDEDDDEDEEFLRPRRSSTKPKSRPQSSTSGLNKKPLGKGVRPKPRSSSRLTK